MPTIHTRTEGRRGCGFRKPGGLYLVCDGPGRPCGRLPIPLVVCPCCHAGIKPTRGFTWIDGGAFAQTVKCAGDDCATCPLSQPMGRVGLLWVGEAFYKTPDAFNTEANEMGISRRISQVPRDFRVGETWIFLAHRKAIPTDTRDESGEIIYVPAVFRIFRPQRIEYVVTGAETDDELNAMERRGITLVRIERAGHGKETNERNGADRPGGGDMTHPFSVREDGAIVDHQRDEVYESVIDFRDQLTLEVLEHTHLYKEALENLKKRNQQLQYAEDREKLGFMFARNIGNFPEPGQDYDEYEEPDYEEPVHDGVNCGCKSFDDCPGR